MMETITTLLDDTTTTKDLRITLKKTRRGQVRRIVREIYLRDDITCGISGCEICDPQENPGGL